MSTVRVNDARDNMLPSLKLMFRSQPPINLYANNEGLILTAHSPS